MFSSEISTTVRRYAEIDEEQFLAKRSCTKCSDRIWFFEMRSGRLKLYGWILFSIELIQTRFSTSLQRRALLLRACLADAASLSYEAEKRGTRSLRAVVQFLSS